MMTQHRCRLYQAGPPNTPYYVEVWDTLGDPYIGKHPGQLLREERGTHSEVQKLIAKYKTDHGIGTTSPWPKRRM